MKCPDIRTFGPSVVWQKIRAGKPSFQHTWKCFGRDLNRWFFLGNKPFILEIIDMALQRKNWWLLPIIILILIVGAVIIFGQSSAISPFIYSLF